MLNANPPKVNVGFDPAANPQFTFDQPSVTLRAAGNVILTQDHDAKWRFQGATVKDDVLDEFHPAVKDSGKSIHIHDKFHDKKLTPYSYNVTVALDGTSYTSPDPVIVNDPGGGGVGE